MLTAPITWALDRLVEATPELKEAYKSASRTLAGDPDNIDAPFTRAVASLSLRLPEHALADFGAIIRLRPEHARAWLLRSEALLGVSMVAGTVLASKAKTVELVEEFLVRRFAELGREEKCPPLEQGWQALRGPWRASSGLIVATSCGLKTVPGTVPGTPNGYNGSRTDVRGCASSRPRFSLIRSSARRWSVETHLTRARMTSR
jgi:hypothetical protein